MPHAHKNHTRYAYNSPRWIHWGGFPKAGAFTKHHTHKFERRNLSDIHLGIQEVLAERAERAECDHHSDENDLYSFWEPAKECAPDTYDLRGDDWLYDYYSDELYYFLYGDDWYDVPELTYRHADEPDSPEKMWLDYEFKKAWEQDCATLHDIYEDVPPAHEPDAAEDIPLAHEPDAAEDPPVDAFKALLQRKYPRCRHLTR